MILISTTFKHLKSICCCYCFFQVLLAAASLASSLKPILDFNLKIKYPKTIPEWLKLPMDIKLNYMVIMVTGVYILEN